MSDIERWAIRLSGVLRVATTDGVTTSHPDKARVLKLRVSSFPFCARRWYLSLPKLTAKAFVSSAVDEWFLRIGTTAHEVLQQAMATAQHDKAVLVQDWLCLDCGHRHVFQPRPSACRFCGSRRLRHEETCVTRGKHLLGHMDGCVAFVPRGQGLTDYSPAWPHVFLDYKTTTLDTVQSKLDTLPYPENVEQLNAYAAIKHEAGVNAVGSVLVYVPRDNPYRYHVAPVPLDLSVLERIDGYERRYEQARAAATLEQARALPTKVKKDFASRCAHCPFTAACESALTDPYALDALLAPAVAAHTKLDSNTFEL